MFRPPSLGPRFVGTLAALDAVTIWGLTFVPSKIALAEMGPFSLAALRFALALLVALLITRRLRCDPRHLKGLPCPSLAPLGFTGVTLFFARQNLGLDRTSATNASLISSSVPAITALLFAALGRERLTDRRLLGILTSMAGVAAIVLAGNAEGSGSTDGELLVAGAAVAWALYTLLVKDLGPRLSETSLLLATMAFETLFLLHRLSPRPPPAASARPPPPAPSRSCSSPSAAAGAPSSAGTRRSVASTRPRPPYTSTSYPWWPSPPRP